MPIGVPKVAFLIPGDEEGSWVDIYNGLYRRRLLFLGQALEREVSNQIIGLIAYLTIEDSTLDQYLFINSPGGSIIGGIGIYDMMQGVKPDVHTLALGVVASMASFILVGGTITKRLAYPHARVMIHQPASSFFRAPAGDFVMEIGTILYMRENITRAYARRTGQHFVIIWHDMDRDCFMSATEAKAYGIVDLVSVDQ
uniref:ATP-dependent protease proteolytic subunit n=1 Tax=Triplostegia grandiflora TaxID=179861 RepID=UPI0023D886C7|nr:ATP-dependent protease proteolytic subunit [Triplostegia grandiflora]WCQ83525.1 ATP-dependent Clp protease proteolytic subunit [Triplostegia sp. 20213]WCR48994.1 ATP-dependent Clp protease proteolytic subunit [Triplostegia sp. 20785]WCR49077.1 ATP-dependent Clp protease proteolytic subunit [Triplostegia sp. 20922]WCR49160.1 ATP-dependent Clp protease proteolytic subunit [Triplostegia sp. 201048]WCR49243.1 ATP-dependent Clp protease proteolytic subunit [Triplostegia sp. 201190]WCR49326.1 AT